MDTKQITIPYGEKDIRACITSPVGCTVQYAVILTHGAGGDMDLPQLVSVANTLASTGFLVLRFTCKGLNINYRVKVYSQILNYLKNHHPELKGSIIGGRSMGARAAVMMENEIQDTDLGRFVMGVVCLSYPLHKPNTLSELRDMPIRQLTRPSLFVSGTKDNMCDKTKMESVLRDQESATVVWLEGGDHGLTKVSGETRRVEDSVCHWCVTLTGPTSGRMNCPHDRNDPSSSSQRRPGPTKRKLSNQRNKAKRKK